MVMEVSYYVKKYHVQPQQLAIKKSAGFCVVLIYFHFNPLVPEFYIYILAHSVFKM